MMWDEGISVLLRCKSEIFALQNVLLEGNYTFFDDNRSCYKLNWPVSSNYLFLAKQLLTSLIRPFNETRPNSTAVSLLLSRLYSSHSLRLHTSAPPPHWHPLCAPHPPHTLSAPLPPLATLSRDTLNKNIKCLSCRGWHVRFPLRAITRSRVNFLTIADFISPAANPPS